MDDQVKEVWGLGGAYEQYVGRWSRVVAQEFVAWLGIPPGQTWGDVGCGSGALMGRILASGRPKSVYAIDRASGFVVSTRDEIQDARAGYGVADAAALPWANGCCHATVSGLVLNFVPNAVAMAKEMARVTRPNGRVAVYVWDYGGGMEMMRHFWDVAIQVDPQAAALDEAERFPLCQPQPLKKLFQEVGLSSVVVRPLDVPTIFRDFDDYWKPFLSKQGPAPTYLASLEDGMRDQIREILKARLVAAAGGAIHLTARAWAVQGVV